MFSIYLRSFRSELLTFRPVVMPKSNLNRFFCENESYLVGKYLNPWLRHRQ